MDCTVAHHLREHGQRLGGAVLDVSGEGLERNQLKACRQGDLLLSEELYAAPQAHGIRFPQPQPWMVVVQSGALVFELDHGGDSFALAARGDGPNVCLTTAPRQDLRAIRPGTLLTRVKLPASCRWKPRAASWCGRVDLSLLVPMARTALAVAACPPAPEVVGVLAEALFRHIHQQLGAAGVQLSQELDPLTLVLEHIQVAAEEDLSLADLAEAASISARRLQELTKEKFNLTPMELLRRERLKLLHRYIRDPRQQGVPLGTLLRRLHLSVTAKTRETFKAEYGALPSELRRLCRYGDRLDRVA